MASSNLKKKMTRRGLFTSLGTSLTSLVSRGGFGFVEAPEHPQVVINPEAVERRKRGRNGS